MLLPRLFMSGIDFARAAVIAGPLALLGACGWQPLYSVSPDGANASVDLARISIPEARSRTDQLIRNNLKFLLNPDGVPGSPLYRLDFVASVTRSDALVQRNTDVRRIQYQMSVSYKLLDLATNQPVTSGNSFSIVAFTRVDSEFANVRADADAQKKTARAVAEDIKTRLAAFFSVR